MQRVAIGGTIVFVADKRLFYVYSAFYRLNPTERFIIVETTRGCFVFGSHTLKVPKRFTTAVYFPSVGFFNERFSNSPFYISLFGSLKHAKEEAKEAIGDIYGVRDEKGKPCFILLSKEKPSVGFSYGAKAVLEKIDGKTFFYDLKTMRVFEVADGDDDDDGNLSAETGV